MSAPCSVTIPQGDAPMEASPEARVLIVANKTAATPALIEAVRARAASNSPNAYDDIVAELDANEYDEIILSTLPSHVSHWLHLDLPARVAHLGYPVVTVTAPHERRHAAAGR